MLLLPVERHVDGAEGCSTRLAPLQAAGSGEED